MKKTVSMILAIVMIAAMLVTGIVPASAEVAAWDGTTATAPAGTGTEADPYLIATGANLAWMSAQSATNDFSGKFFVQTADIDLGGKNFTSIGTKYVTGAAAMTADEGTIAFKGNYDGKGFTISNATLKCDSTPKLTDHLGFTETHPAALFGVVVDGTIANINAVNLKAGAYNEIDPATKYKYEGANASKLAEVYDTVQSAIIVGVLNHGTVTGCTTDGDCRAAGAYHTGGIVGYACNGSTVSYCVNNGTVASDVYVGGIVGCASDVTITYCVNNGAIRLMNVYEGYRCLGGIVGAFDDRKKPAECENVVSYCINGENASIWHYSGRHQSGKNSCIGSIVGAQGSSLPLCNINHCYNLVSTYTIYTTMDQSNPQLVGVGGIIGMSSASTDKPITMDCVSTVRIGKVWYYMGTGTDWINGWAAPNGRDASFVDGSHVIGYNDLDNVYYAGIAGIEKCYAGRFTVATPGSLVYGATAASIKASNDYLAIMNSFAPAAGANYAGCQLSAVADSKFGVRFVATLDKLDYEAAGFKITIGDKTAEKNVTAAYASLLGTEEGKPAVYTAKDLGGNWLIALSITGINAETTITVQPYTVTGGAKTYGTAYTVVLSADGALTSQSVAV